jgi:DNA adenine methylase
MALKHPILRYHGSKHKMATWLAQHAPPAGSYTHRITVCAGGLGELLGTDDWPIEGISETVNDYSKQVSDFWRCIRDTHNFNKFKRLAELTPFSEIEFNERKELYNSQYIAERALAFFIEMRQGVQGTQGAEVSFATPTTRTRSAMNEQVSAWLSAVERLPEVYERLKRVEIRQLPADKMVRSYDHPKAFFIIDPPYLEETRTGGIGQYRNEWTYSQHDAFLSLLSTIQGKFMLCGYASQLYNDYAHRLGWNRYGKYVDKVSSRAAVTPQAWEYVWCNY